MKGSDFSVKMKSESFEMGQDSSYTDAIKRDDQCSKFYLVTANMLHNIEIVLLNKCAQGQ